MEIMNFSKEEQFDFFRVVAAVLFLGNMEFKDARNDEALLPDTTCASPMSSLGLLVVLTLLNSRCTEGRSYPRHSVE